jgi:hypothetical protein
MANFDQLMSALEESGMTLTDDQRKAMDALKAVLGSTVQNDTLTTMTDTVKEVAAKLNGGEYFLWKYPECNILIAKPAGGDTLISMPITPREFWTVSDRQGVQDWLDSFTMFSPGTIGSAFATMFKEVQFNGEGDRYAVCPKCQRHNDPSWSDCSCDE